MKKGDAGGRGEAGRRGDDIRSDIWVSIALDEGGGIRIDCRSRVGAYYGDAIQLQVTDVLTGLGVGHARVELIDSGALPFVIAARVEAAALRAGVSAAATPPAPVEPCRPSPRNAMRRSRLYLPGNEPKYLINAGLYGADAVILDLEDSVHAAAKTDARLLVRNALQTIDFGRSERMVRINQLPLGIEDLAAVIPAGPDLILLPKIEHADQVREVDRAIEGLLEGSERSLWLMPIIESALGVENAFEIAGASNRVAALTIGLEDYAADVGVPRSAEGVESLYARLRLINAARGASIQAIDSVYGQVDDLVGLRQWAERSRRQGFVGMGCLHPRQIAVIHESFNPTPEEIDRAGKIVRAARTAEREGRAVVSLGSKMIDPPVVRQALDLVGRARELGLVHDETDDGDADGPRN